MCLLKGPELQLCNEPIVLCATVLAIFIESKLNTLFTFGHDVVPLSKCIFGILYQTIMVHSTHIHTCVKEH